MKKILQFIIDSALILWLGGIFFFGAIMAPSVFQVMSIMDGGATLAGFIIAQALYGMHSMALICGVVILLVSTWLHKKLFRTEHLLVLAMLALTCFSQFNITPKIESIRYSVKRMDQLAATDERKIEFDKLHKMSTATEGVVFLLGLAIVWVRSAKDE